MIPFSEWRPDIAAFDTSAASDALNVVASSSGYIPFQSLTATGFAASEWIEDGWVDEDAFVDDGSVSVPNTTVYGAISAKVNGLILSFCGDATALYKLDSTGRTWEDVSRLAGGDYATADDGRWQFTVYGNYIITTNGVDPPQYWEAGVSSNWAALPGSPPVAKYIGVSDDFVVLANTEDGENQMRWSAINNAFDWAASETTMSDTQTFPDGGPITGFAGGQGFSIVFQERAIRRMAFEGPPRVFRFDDISTEIGCRAGGSIAAYGATVFFLGNSGFYRIDGGTQLTPIGSEKVDAWFAARVDDANRHRITATIDPMRQLYVVGFPDGTYTDGTPAHMLIYHWPTQRWSHVEQDHELIFNAIPQAGYTIDGLGSLSSTIDGLVYPFDSSFYSGSERRILAGFTTTHRHGFFNGTAKRAVIETGDAQLIPGRKSLLRGLRPMVEGTSVTPELTVLYRDRLQDAHSQTVTPVPANDLGFCPVRVNARYHRARVAFPEGSTWNFATGIDDLKFVAMGAR